MTVNLTTILKNDNGKKKTINKTTATKEKNKITYQLDGEKYTLKIVSSHKIVMYRNSDNYECTMFFEINKETTSIYTIKKEEYTLEINIKTLVLNIKDNEINIKYYVKDSNEIYEYTLEMSEKNEY